MNLDRRILIEQAAESANGIGEPIKTWSTFAAVWSEISPVRETERFTAQQVDAQRESRFRIRWLSGVTEKMRISYDSAYWDITGIREIGRRDGLEIVAVVRR